jgi:membrane-associated protein
LASIADHIKTLDGGLAYLLVFALVFAEDALFVGFVLPGETAAILGGVVAHRGHASLPVMIAVVVVAAITGDSVGYEVGRRFGPRLVETRALRRHSHRLIDAREFLERRGGWAVFLGRWTAFFRAVMPALAGLAHMRYRRFFAFNAAGGLCWGVAVVLLGYFASSTYEKIVKTFGRGAAVLAVLAVVGLIVGRVVRERRRERAEEAADPVDPLDELEELEAPLEE